MTLITYPLDNIDYTADDAALFHATRTTGIYAEDSFSYSVSGADNLVKLSPGLAWLGINRFKGMVAAMKTETSLDMGLPDPVYPRIDHVVLQFSANKNTTELVAKQGTAASTPLPPERSTTEALYEIHLLRVRREPGAVSITAADLTDLRLDRSYCGLMADSVTEIDMDSIQNQCTAILQMLSEELENVKGGAAYVLKTGDTMTGPLNVPEPSQASHAVNKGYTDKMKSVTVTLLAAGWTGAGSYTQSVSVAGMTGSWKPGAPTLETSGDKETDLMAQEAFDCVSLIESGEGMLTFTCYEDMPGADFTVCVPGVLK